MNKIIIKIKNSKIDIITTISFLSLYISIALFFNNDYQVSEQNGNIKSFSNEWLTEDKGKIKDIPGKQSTSPGRALYIENSLPEIDDDEFLQLYSSKSQIKVFLSGELLFRYPENNEINPVNRVLYIPLKREYSNKTVGIEIKSYYRKYSGRINEIFIANYNSILSDKSNWNRSMLFLYIISITIGVMVILIYFFIPNHKNYVSWLFLGLFCILLSLQYIFEYNLANISSDKIDIVNNIFFYSSLLVPLSLLTCFYGATRYTKLLNSGAVIFSSLTLFLILLNNAGVFLFSSSLYYYKFVCFLFYSVTLVVVFFEAMIYGDTRLITVFLASLLLLITALIETVSHYYFLMSYRNAGLIQGSGLISYMLIMIVAPVYSGVEKIETNLQLRNELVEKRIQLMISQIRPHFIYNTLNSIQALISIDPQKSEEMLNDFSKYLRTHIDLIEGDEVVLFSEEINNIKTYVNIELVRFPRLSVEYHIEEDMFMVPSLSIQPIVENAIKHGISKKAGNGKVLISSSYSDGKYVIIVSDNGVGFDSSRQEKHASIGIENVKARLVAMCDAGISIESKENLGTTVTIQIPKEDTLEDDFS